MKPTKLLLVDDDDTLRRVLTKEMQQLGFDVVALGDARDIEARVEREQPDVVLLDLKLPGVDGHQALASIRRTDQELPVVVLTGHGSVEDAVAAMRAGAYDFLQKPTRTALLEQTLRRACERRALGQENERLRRITGAAGAPKLLGESPVMQDLRAQVDRVGRGEGSVLVLGENGCGKELVARAVHASSSRCGQNFVVVNCSAIPDDLVHSELFGHVRGSFTGADRPRVGLFEAAHGGTLFLDEIGDLPLESQPALLRATQFGEVRPVGSETTRTVDVRVIAATNRDLHGMIQTGSFREDLYYRLATLEIVVPPLRARSGDVPMLAQAFLRQASARRGREVRFSDAALSALTRHNWPGNVRELENAVTRLVVMTDGESIEVDAVEKYVLTTARPFVGELPTLDVAELEQLAIDAAMKRYDGDKRRAAEAMGISLKTLYNKLNAREHTA
ncbi:MAG: sigma-54 dependent transcriptional regulator [Planctomycetota bacterium]